MCVNRFVNLIRRKSSSFDGRSCSQVDQRLVGDQPGH